MKTYKYPDKDNLLNILKRPVLDNADVKIKVAEIVQNVHKKGDKALRAYTKNIDGIDLVDFQVSPTEIESAERQLSKKLKKAIKQAAKNIRTFHKAQIVTEKQIKTMSGVICWRKNIPIQKVGLYIPGGSAPLFSTVLMLALPAQLAGCPEIVLVSPPDKQGDLHPAILYAAKISSVTKIFKAGGAQAIAALVYGTESIPKVDKIFGPGNRYVTFAKQLVQAEGVAIDMPAGPSEVVVLADESADARFVAADLLAQAEHGADSQVFLFTDSGRLIEKVSNEVNRQIENLPRTEIAGKALQNSASILLKSLDEALAAINYYAPEHLIINTKNPHTYAEQVVNAGSVFVGPFSSEACGDYASGTNHTLPTNGFARAYSGVSMDSYFKKITFQEVTKKGLKNIGPIVETLAKAEQLQAHKNSITIRLKKM
jgi:histidinol dehydrogenase